MRQNQKRSLLMNLEFLMSLSFNIQAIIGAILIWIFSWLWHDYIVVKPWLRWTGMTIAEARELHSGRLALDLGLYLISKVALSYSCFILIMLIKPNGAYEYILLATTLSLGLVFSAGAGPVIFENRHVGLWLLSSILTTLSVFVLFALSFVIAEAQLIH
jgi:hypothetical protein